MNSDELPKLHSLAAMMRSCAALSCCASTSGHRPHLSCPAQPDLSVSLAIGELVLPCADRAAFAACSSPTGTDLQAGFALHRGQAQPPPASPCLGLTHG